MRQRLHQYVLLRTFRFIQRYVIAIRLHLYNQYVNTSDPIIFNCKPLGEIHKLTDSTDTTNNFSRENIPIQYVSKRPNIKILK